MNHSTTTRLRSIGTLVALFALTACGGGDDSGPATPATPSAPAPAPPASSYTVGGTVSGLGSGKSLVLRNNGAGNLPVSANGAFAFSTQLTSGTAFAVTVFTQPAGQHCTASAATGNIASANVTGVKITCADDSGQLDTSFGAKHTGLVTHNSAAGGNAADLANALAIDSQGRIVAAGLSIDMANQYNMAVWRYKADGTPDTSFNGTGYATHAGVGGETIATGVVIDSSGRIVVCGHARDAAGYWGMALWRYTATGVLDTSFGGTGFVRFSSSDAGSFGLALDATGRIVVAGYLYNGTDWDSALWRYKADGTPDDTFNGSGLFTTSFAPAGDVKTGEDIAAGVAIDANGRILQAGYARTAANVFEMYVARYTAAGAPDTSFNGTGVLRHGGGGTGDAAGKTIALDGSQRILVGGSISAQSGTAANDDAAVWRITSSGTLDTSFNGVGYVKHNSAAGGDGVEEVRSIAVDGSGRIVFGGTSKDAADVNKMAVWRYSASGVLDASFATGGIFVDTGTKSGARCLKFDATDHLLVAGQKNNASDVSDMALWRLTP